VSRWRGHDGDHGIQPTHHVVDGSAGAQRAAGRIGHVGKAAHHLHHFVERGAMFVSSGQETLAQAIHQPRMFRRQIRRRKAELAHRARGEKT
jgi:hypothetical protein